MPIARGLQVMGVKTNYCMKIHQRTPRSSEASQQHGYLKRKAINAIDYS